MSMYVRPEDHKLKLATDKTNNGYFKQNGASITAYANELHAFAGVFIIILLFVKYNTKKLPVTENINGIIEYRNTCRM
jgi:hypothetical protein